MVRIAPLSPGRPNGILPARYALAGGGPLQTAPPEYAAARRRVCYRNPAPPDVLSFTEN
ncbi:hypothetical protein BLA39750_07938 [Burkholderia lata]|uniref:Uncharacterized protein n=1 Tax=Burkholderia lata (strain ATCC 17760 / DSM 23089 / LMG 22485 / NCIMB 9086 / R18194 / 383) TaxID=482957 RepID=A0A6P3CB96_BURL3|nr:hypothetical protein BLA39750_07938 [Burkholderia lata]